jgi:uncharacterized DUF497 family protein
MTIEYNFEWDPVKARTNQKKHGISFEQAAAVFRDPKALSIFDEDHSDDENRWLTLGMSGPGAVVVVVHTFREIGDQITLRIISARPATRKELRQYEANL